MVNESKLDNILLESSKISCYNLFVKFMKYNGS